MIAMIHGNITIVQCRIVSPIPLLRSFLKMRSMERLDEKGQ
jgi:hypothetical protein